MPRFNPCDICDRPTDNREDDYGNFICNSCVDDAAERAWERHCTNYYGGGGSLSLQQQQLNARRLK